MTAQNPTFGEIIKMPQGGFDDLPSADVPYYAQGSDGLFIHRDFLFGHGAVRTKPNPNWPALGNSTGSFVFNADPIPAKLMSQIVHFFRRIYERQKTEAAVLLTMHETTKEWGVYIPTQLVSHGGVNYVYDPLTITDGRTVVGSIHSHCDFSPFHSGTDTGDAEDFDGFHATVGFIMRDTPGIVAMVSMNKENMHYKEDLFPKLFDYTELWKHEAPAWWDRYVEDTRGTSRTKPAGFELYKRFEKPTVVKEEKRTVVTANNAKRWTPPVQKPLPRMERDPWWLDKTPEWLDNNHYIWSNEKQTYVYDRNSIPSFQPLRESSTFNARKTAERGILWDTKGRMIWDGWDDDGLDPFTANDWAEELAKNTSVEFVDALLMTTNTLVTEEDDNYAYAHPDEASRVQFWQDLLLCRIRIGIDLLAMTGINIEIMLAGKTSEPESEDTKQWLLPEPERKLHVVP